MKTNQVALFTFTQPELMAGIGTVAKKNGVVVDAIGLTAEQDKDSVSLTLKLDNRKAVADRLGLKLNKDNASRIDAELLRMKDVLKKAAIGEMVKLATDPNWTGGSYRLAQMKNGTQRATMSMVSVNRNAGRLSAEDLAKALASLTEDEQVAIMERAEAMAKLLTPAIEVDEAKALKELEEEVAKLDEEGAKALDESKAELND